MAQQLAAHDPPIPVAAIDATVSKKIAKRYDITGYPTVFAFRGTTAVHYDDEKKNTKDMVQYMQQEHPARVLAPGPHHRGPTNLPSKGHFDKFLEMKAFTKPAVVAFIPEHAGKGGDQEEAAAISQYQMAHYGLREKFAFGIVRAPTIISAIGATAGEVRVYKAGAYYAKKFEQRHHAILDWGDIHSLKEAIVANCLPLVGEMHAESQEHYHFARHHSQDNDSTGASVGVGIPKPLLLVYTNVNFDHKGGRYYKETRNFAKQIRGIVAPFREHLNIALGDKTAAAKSLEALGFPTGADKIATIQHGTMKYKFVGASTAHFKTRMTEFVEGFVNGHLEPYYRTADTPCCTLHEALTEGRSLTGEVLPSQMLELIGKTAHNLVMDSEKDTMIEIYAPGCPHCLALKPHWEELNSFINEHEELQQVLQLAVINGALNDVPINGITIPGFPAIFYVPGDYIGTADRSPVHVDLAPPPSGYGKLTSSLLQALADQPRIARSDRLRMLIQERLTAALQAEAAAADAAEAEAVGAGAGAAAEQEPQREL